MSIFDQNVKKLNVNKRKGKNNNRKKSWNYEGASEC